MADKAATREEPKLTLPVNHPHAGYVTPDTSFTDNYGETPEERKAREEAENAREHEAAAVADHEHKVATAEAAAAEKAQAKAQAKA